MFFENPLMNRNEKHSREPCVCWRAFLMMKRRTETSDSHTPKYNYFFEIWYDFEAVNKYIHFQDDLSDSHENEKKIFLIFFPP